MAFGGLKGSALTVTQNSITNPTDIAGSVAVAVGDLIFGVIGEQASLTATTTITDNLGNTYAYVNAGTDAGTSTGRAFWSRVTVAGTLTVIHVPATASSDNVAAVAGVWEGPFSLSPLDKAPSNITSDITSPFTCPSTTTLSQANEVVLAWAVATGSTAWTATSPNTLLSSLATQSVLHTVVGYQTVTATTAVAPVFAAASNPTDAVLGTVSFKRAENVSISPGQAANSVPVLSPTAPTVARTTGVKQMYPGQVANDSPRLSSVAPTRSINYQRNPGQVASDRPGLSSTAPTRVVSDHKALSPAQVANNLPALSPTAPIVARTANRWIVPNQVASNLPAISSAAPIVAQTTHRWITPAQAANNLPLLSSAAPAVAIASTGPTYSLPAAVGAFEVKIADEVTFDRSMSADTGMFEVAGAGEVSFDLEIQSATTDISISSVAPTVQVQLQGVSVEALPGQAAVGISVFVPTVARTDHHWLTISQSDVKLSGVAPEAQSSASVSKSPDAANVSLSVTAPTYRGRVPEQVTEWDDPYHVTIIPNIADSPGRPGAADKIQEVLEESPYWHRLDTYNVQLPAVGATFSIELKAAGRDHFNVYAWTTDPGADLFNLDIDIADKSASTIFLGDSTFGVTDLGDGWIRAEVFANSLAQAEKLAGVEIAVTSPTYGTYSGDGSSGVLVGRVLMRAGQWVYSYSLPTKNIGLSATVPTVTRTDHHWFTVPQTSLALSKIAPEVQAGASVGRLPAARDVSLSVVVPSAARTDHHWVATSQGDVAVSRTAPTVGVSNNHRVIPDQAFVALSPIAPALGQSTHRWLTPNRVDIAFSEEAPEVQSGASIGKSPAHTGVTLSPTIPNVIVNYRMLAGIGAFTVKIADEISSGRSMPADTGSFEVAGASEISVDLSVGSQTGDVALSTSAPNIQIGVFIEKSPASAGLSLSPTAPSVTKFYRFSVEAGLFVLNGSAAFADLELVVASASRLLSPSAPTVEVSGVAAIVRTPARRDIALSTSVPAVVVSTAIARSPARRDIALSTSAPTVATAIALSPARRDIALSTSAPIVTTATYKLTAESGTFTWTIANRISFDINKRPDVRSLGLTTSVPEVFVPIAGGRYPAAASIRLTTSAPYSTRYIKFSVDTGYIELGGAAPSRDFSMVAGTGYFEIAAADQISTDLQILSSAADRTLSTSVPEVVAGITPLAAANLRLSTTAPSVTRIYRVSVEAGLFELIGAAARSDLTLEIATRGITLTRLAPVVAVVSGDTNVVPSTAERSLTSEPPEVQSSASITKSPARTHITLSVTEPGVAVSTHRWLVPTQADVTLSETVSTVAKTFHHWKTPAQSDVSLTRTGPTLAQTAHRWLTPSRVDIRFSSQPPEIRSSASISKSPAAADVTLSRVASTVVRTDKRWLTGLVRDLGLSSVAPTVVRTANRNITVPVRDLALSKIAPTVARTANRDISSATRDLGLSKVAPAVARTDKRWLTGLVRDLGLNSVAPTVVRTANRNITVPVRDLALSKVAPAVARTAHRNISSATRDLALSKAAPAVARTAKRWMTPATADLTLTRLEGEVQSSASVYKAPARVDIRLSATAPIVARTTHRNIVVPVRQLSFSLVPPTVWNSDLKAGLPAAVDLAIATSPPLVEQTRHHRRSPVSIHTVLSGPRPIVVTTAHRWLSPEADQLELHPYQLQLHEQFPIVGRLKLSASSPLVTQVTLHWPRVSHYHVAGSESSKTVSGRARSSRAIAGRSRSAIRIAGQAKVDH